MKRRYTLIVLFISTALLTISIFPIITEGIAKPTGLWLECDINSNYFDDYGSVYITGSNPTLEFRGSEFLEEIHTQIYSTTYGGGWFASAAEIACENGYAEIDLKDIIKTIDADTGEPFIEAQHIIGYYGLSITGSHFPSSGFKYLVSIKGSSYSWDTNMVPIKVDMTKPEIHNIDISGGIFSKVVTVTATDQESGMRNLNVLINGEDYNNGQIYGEMGGAYMTYVLTLDSLTSLQLETVEVTAKDMAGHTSVKGHNVEPSNSPPDTPNRPSGPGSGDAGPTYEYCTCAEDPDGDQIKYGFDWGDGSGTTWTSFANSGETACVSHQYDSSGDYTVKAIAKDEFDLQSSWSSGLTVHMGEENYPPDTPNRPSGPSSGRTGPSYEYCTCAEDDDGNQIKYGFDWGDGSGTTWTSFVGSGETACISHQYDSSGDYIIKAITQDTKDAKSGWSSGKTVHMTANQAPRTPSMPSGEMEGDVGLEYEYISHAVTDPEGDKVTYKFNWGDGTNSGWVESVEAEHIWTSKGDYEVTIIAKDQYSATSNSEPLSINMNNDPPEKPEIPVGPTNGKTEETITFTTSSIDSNGHKVKYYFTWGDGDDGWTELTGSGLQASASHTWSDTGSFDIKLKAVDEYGEESDWSESVNIEITKNKSINKALVNLIFQRFFQRFSILIQYLSNY